MKNIYLVIATGLFAAQNMHAQLTLTQAANGPVIGDLTSYVDYDTTAAIPRNIGTNQTWDFSSARQGTYTSGTSTIVAASSSTAASQFPGANIAETVQTGVYSFYKSDASQIDILGFSDFGGSTTFTSNPRTMIKWPTAYGSTFSDTYSGTMTGIFSGTVGGSSTVTATGSGNLILPGGSFYSNVLQLKTIETSTTMNTSPVATTIVQYAESYSYYHSSNKSALLTVYISNGDVSVLVNKRVAVGLTDYNFDATFAIYPNPAKSHFNVKLSNTNNQSCFVKIYSATGQLVKDLDLGKDSDIVSEIAIHDLTPGMYFVKTSLGDKSSTRRLVVQ